MRKLVIEPDYNPHGNHKKKPRTANDPSKVPPGKKFHVEYIEETQAERIINLFGGIDELRDALEAVGCKRSYTQVRRWLLPIEAVTGTKGLIPYAVLPFIMEAARYDGIVLTASDLDFGVRKVKVVHTPDNE